MKNPPNDVALQPGQEIAGFAVQRVTPLKNLRATACELAHRKTGARILHVHAPHDSENLFAIAFPTPPHDDTGLPHILEHSVLGGSKRFPVKDPFVEMLKMSMATFINAMTYPDHTVYPTASNVRRDFYNLAEVYWDAVFHPRLTEGTFKQEGHHFEFATAGDTASALTIKGIVFNEMKGAYSMPDTLIGRRAMDGLFPDTPYGRDSGGDPDAIPTLTYKDFIRFHREYYHPSNAYIFFYGDLPTREHLAFLAPRLRSFTRQRVRWALPRQPRWTEPRTCALSYPLGVGEDPRSHTFLVLSWLAGDGADALDVAAFSILNLVLTGHQGAPLRKALIDSKLGEDLTHTGFHAGTLESVFSIGLKGSEPGRAEAFVQLATATLARIAADGIPKERLDAAFQQIAYQLLEIQAYFPLHLMEAAYATWIYGADPLLFLRADEVLAELRRRMETDPGLFPRLIRERLLDNPHRMLVVCTPDPEMQAKKDAAFAARMAERKARFKPAQLARIAREAAALEQRQGTPNSPKALATLPQLRVRDLPPKPKHIPTEAEKLPGGATLLVNDVFANGVSYLHLDLDLAGLPVDLLPYLPLYGDCVRKLGAAGLDYVRTAERVAALTGGVSFSTAGYTHVQEPERSLRRGCFSWKALDENVPQALTVLHDLVYDLDFGDRARLKEVLVQARAAHRTNIARRGVGLAQCRAGRGLSREGCLLDLWHGLPQVRLIEQYAGDFDARAEELTARLEAVRRFIREHGVWTASFTGGAQARPQVAAVLESWIAARRPVAAAEQPLVPPVLAAPPRDGLAHPMDVAFCGQVMPAPHVSHADSALLRVASSLLTFGYCWEEIRVKGGAYGGACRYDPFKRTWELTSWFDPTPKRTLDVFAALREHIGKAKWSRKDIERAVIGTAKTGERPIRPGPATGEALALHVVGDTRELREARHAAILRATPQEVRRAALELLERSLPLAGVCVVSSREKLEAANKELAAPLAVEDVLAGS